MAVTTKVESPVKAKATDVNLEMFKVKRYMYNGMLYEKGVVYVFDAESAKVVLSQVDPQGVPVFGLAKPRTKLVQIPQELQTVAMRQVKSPMIDSGDTRKVTPVGRLELGDDDPEITARLAQADADNEVKEVAIVV